MRLSYRVAALESRTVTNVNNPTTVRYLIIKREDDGALKVTGWRERDLQTGKVRNGDGPYDA